MVAVLVTIPSMLATLVNGDRRFTVEADDIPGAVEALLTRHPELRVHLFTEEHTLRRHVMLFHNDTAIRELRGSVGPDDTLTVLQAVSGG
jgi:hypothetical protein